MWLEAFEQILYLFFACTIRLVFGLEFPRGEVVVCFMILLNETICNSPPFIFFPTSFEVCVAECGNNSVWYTRMVNTDVAFESPWAFKGSRPLIVRSYSVLRFICKSIAPTAIARGSYILIPLVNLNYPLTKMYAIKISQLHSHRHHPVIGAAE